MRSLISGLALALAACATVHQGGQPSDLRGEVIRSATELIGQRQLMFNGHLLAADCLALPRAAFGEHGIDLRATTALSLYRRLQREGHVFGSPDGSHGDRPQRGDLVFMRDLGREQALHVGLVGRVESDGTVTIYQRMAHGVEAYRMNLAHPHDGFGADHRPWNDSIAAGNGDTAPAGALFAAYASILP